MVRNAMAFQDSTTPGSLVIADAEGCAIAADDRLSIATAAAATMLGRAASGALAMGTLLSAGHRSAEAERIRRTGAIPGRLPPGAGIGDATAGNRPAIAP